MSETIYALLRLLADGRFHSGQELGQSLGISRAAVCKAMQQLPQLGLHYDAVTGRGYRLHNPLELLAHDSILQHLKSHCSNDIHRLVLANSIPSTNDYLKELALAGAASSTVCIAESQSAGRGRRGRNWHSPFGSNIYLSLLWRFNDGMAALGGLSLVVAIALMRCFQQLGATGLGIKWPNDIYNEQGKLAGILVDVAGEASGPCFAVIGIGVNYAMPSSAENSIDQAWTDLQSLGISIGRNELAAHLVCHLIKVIDEYQRCGFRHFLLQWQQWDILRDRPATLQIGDKKYRGYSRGIDDAGLLLFEYDGVTKSYAAGDVSLRTIGNDASH